MLIMALLVKKLSFAIVAGNVDVVFGYTCTKLHSTTAVATSFAANIMCNISLVEFATI
jgi:hypothetical protein